MMVLLFGWRQSSPTSELTFLLQKAALTVLLRTSIRRPGVMMAAVCISSKVGWFQVFYTNGASKEMTAVSLEWGNKGTSVSL